MAGAPAVIAAVVAVVVVVADGGLQCQHNLRAVCDVRYCPLPAAATQSGAAQALLFHSNRRLRSCRALPQPSQ